MAIYILSKNERLIDYICHELPECVGSAPDASSLPPDALCIVDADTVPPPYPATACLLLAHTPKKGSLPCLVHPLMPGELRIALGGTEEDLPRIILSDGQKSKIDGHLTLGSISVRLTPPELALCQALLSTLLTEEPISRVTLSECLLNANSQSRDKNGTLTVYMYRLRKKLAPLGITLVTHRMGGYSLRKEK